MILQHLQHLPSFLFAATAIIVLSLQSPHRKQDNDSSKKQKEGYNVVAIDLDGTALNSNHALSDETAGKLKDIHARGIKICIATGRSLGSVMKVIDDLKLNAELYVVCLNGAMGVKVLQDGKTTEKLFDDGVNASSAEKLLSFASRKGLVAQYYIDSVVYAAPQTDSHRELLARYEEVVGKKQKIVPDYSIPVSLSPASKILIMTNDTDKLLADAKAERLDEDFHIILGSPYSFFVEFLGPGINKGSGFVKMCQKTNWDISNAISFGDGENDKEFLLYAGHGVAMRNARPLAKFAADAVIPWTNDENGVVRYLDKLDKEGLLIGSQ